MGLRSSEMNFPDAKGTEINMTLGEVINLVAEMNFPDAKGTEIDS